MPRDSGGTYTLPAGNPVVSGTTIESVWANTTMDDIAEALTDSLSRSGKGGMSVSMLFGDGTETLPGVAWTSEPSTGLHREDLGDMRLDVLGQKLFRWYDECAFVWDSVNAVWQKIVASNNIDVDPVTGNITFNTDVTFEQAGVNPVVINDATTTRTLSLTESNAMVVFSNAGAITVTVPPNASVAIPIGYLCGVMQNGAGVITVVGGAGVTVTSSRSLITSGTGSSLTMMKIATDEWLLVGDQE